MDAIECIKERRSVRQYSAEPISQDILRELIDCARLAPSANNIQPWGFIVLTEKASLRKVSEVTDYGSFIKSAAACIIVCCKDTKYYLEDGCAATENILLAAKAFGIGSCWIAGDKKNYAEEIKNMFGIPKTMKIVSIVSLGYPKQEIKPHGKRSLNDVLHWEKF